MINIGETLTRIKNKKGVLENEGLAIYPVFFNELTQLGAE